MKRTLLLLFVGLACLAMPFSSAIGAVFERDWYAPGDGLLTYDDVHQRLWLDLSQSLLSQFSGASLEDRYQDAILELQPGGFFEGFTVATTQDVLGLALSAGIDPTTDNFEINEQPVEQLIELLSPTRIVPDIRIWSVGFLDEFSMPPLGNPRRLNAWLDFDPREPFVSRTALRFVPSVDLMAPEIYGVMLYRQVPEPSTLALIVLGLWGFLFGRSKRSA